MNPRKAMTLHGGPGPGAAALRLLAGALGSLAILSCASVEPVTAQVPGAAPSWPPEEEATPTPTPAPVEPGEAVEPIVVPSLADRLKELEEETQTAGGALRYFMSHRSYRTIRFLKQVMTPALAARFDANSVPFNGKRGIRLAAFDFKEKDMKPVLPKAQDARGKPSAQAAGMAGSPGEAVAAEEPAIYAGTVRSLWEEQGEVAEQRVETIKTYRQPEGAWRIGSLELVSSDRPRPPEAIPGVTVLKIILRAWHRRDLNTVRQHLSEAYEKRYQNRPEALEHLFIGEEEPRHAAFQIQDLRPQGDSLLLARVRLFETTPGQPGIFETPAKNVRLIRKGPYWLLDAWD